MNQILSLFYHPFFKIPKNRSSRIPGAADDFSQAFKLFDSLKTTKRVPNVQGRPKKPTSIETVLASYLADAQAGATWEEDPAGVPAEDYYALSRCSVPAVPGKFFLQGAARQRLSDFFATNQPVDQQVGSRVLWYLLACMFAEVPPLPLRSLQANNKPTDGQSVKIKVCPSQGNSQPPPLLVRVTGLETNDNLP